MLGIFVQMNDSKKLSEYKFNQLIDYFIDNLQHKTKEFFGSILRKINLALIFRKNIFKE